MNSKTSRIGSPEKDSNTYGDLLYKLGNISYHKYRYMF